MATENTPPKGSSPGPYAARAARAPRSGKPRKAFRILGLPIVAVAAVFLFNGLRDYVVLPACDSDRAKQTLAQIFKQLQFVPLRYEPIKTISTSKDKVVCNAVLPLPDGANVVADYTFYWEGNKASVKYSISRQAPKSSAITPRPMLPGAKS